MSTHNWFECKVKYIKTGEDGKEKKVSETYLVDAVSYTEAEARIYTELETFIQAPFLISALKKSNISEIIPSDNENDDRWYKGKVAILDADELTGKEKRTNQHVLTAAKDINTALTYLDKSFSTYIVPFEIAQVSDTNIMDVYPYFKNEEEIPDNLTPLSQTEENNEDFE